MAAKNESPEFILDGIGAMPDGMNSGVVPQLLSKTQMAFATNCTFRGGYVRNRPGLRKIPLDFGGDALLQSNFETSIWQGACFFKSEYGSESIVASIGGRLFEVRPSSISKTATVADVSISGDLNSSGNSIAWLWQSERWIIVNDGQALPIFYDGSKSRRSYGASQEVGITSSDFVVPAIGSSVDIVLTANYTGPYNSAIYIGNAFYQVNSSGSGYQVTLKNLSEDAGQVIPIGTQLQTPNNLLGQFNQQIITSGFPTVFSLSVIDALYPIPNNRTDLFIRYSGQDYIAGRTDRTDSLGNEALSFFTFTHYTIPKYSPIYNGAFSATSPTGLVLKSAFTTPAVGSEQIANIAVPFNGSVGQKIVLSGGLYEVTAVNNDPSSSNTLNVTNINDTAGNTVTAGAKLITVPELGVGRMGAYGLGRNWMCLPDGRSFIGGDIVGGSSGTPALNSRDSVLHVTENSYLFGGGAFIIPGNIGDIRSMTFTANLDVSLGQGPLQIGTSTSIFSCNAPVDRAVWDSLTNPILTQSLIGKGPLGQYATLLVNSDTMFRARDGIGSLVLARRDFNSWGNVPISREMQRVIDLDNENLLPNATAIQFDNRLLMGCLPVQGPLGIYHQGIISMNFDPVSSLRGKAASIYDGLWTGIQAFQFVAGQFSGDERAFAFCYNSFSNRIELYELLQSGEGELDNDSSPLTWSFETSALFQSVKGKGAFDLLRLRDGEIYISDIRGAVQIQTWYRPDFSECWTPWHSFGVCAAADQNQYRSRLGLGIPSIDDCDPTNNRPLCIGNNFQVRVQITGACKFMGMLLKATPEQETNVSVPICKPLCEAVSDALQCEPCVDRGNCLTFPIVFYNLNANKTYTNDTLPFDVSCPDGSTRTVYVQAGRVSYTLPFPTGYTGEYPPLIMGCQEGGNIVRNIPSGATQADIDAIVNEMITTCARAIAEAEVDCTAAPNTAKNETVYFVHLCDAGDLVYNGTLPSWITLDAANFRLVGAAGVFSGPNQAIANSNAQSALDSFGNAALLSGDLECFVTPPISCVAFQSAVNVTTGTRRFAETKSAAHRIVGAINSSTGGFYIIDTSTNAAVFTTTDLFNGGCFALSQLRFFVVPSASGTTVKAYSSAGASLSTITVPKSGQNVVYDPVNDRVVGAYVDAGTNTLHFYTINPSSYAVGDVDTGLFPFAVFDWMFYADGLIIALDLDGSIYQVFDATTLAFIGTVDSPNNNEGVDFAANTGKLYFASSTGAQNTVVEVNPATLVTDFTFNMPSAVRNVNYNPVNGAIYAICSGAIVVINPVSRTIVCTLTAANRRDAAMVDYSSGTLFSTVSAGSNTLQLYA